MTELDDILDRMEKARDRHEHAAYALLATKLVRQALAERDALLLKVVGAIDDMHQAKLSPDEGYVYQLAVEIRAMLGEPK